MGGERKHKRKKGEEEGVVSAYLWNRCGQLPFQEIAGHGDEASRAECREEASFSNEPV